VVVYVKLLYNFISILNYRDIYSRTLAQFLAAQEKPLDERDILDKFMQIVLAIKCIHMHNILHRCVQCVQVCTGVYSVNRCVQC